MKIDEFITIGVEKIRYLQYINITYKVIGILMVISHIEFKLAGNREMPSTRLLMLCGSE